MKQNLWNLTNHQQYKTQNCRRLVESAAQKKHPFHLLASQNLNQLLKTIQLLLSLDGGNTNTSNNRLYIVVLVMLQTFILRKNVGIRCQNCGCNTAAETSKSFILPSQYCCGDFKIPYIVVTIAVSIPLRRLWNALYCVLIDIVILLRRLQNPWYCGRNCACRKQFKTISSRNERKEKKTNCKILEGPPTQF